MQAFTGSLRVIAGYSQRIVSSATKKGTRDATCDCPPDLEVEVEGIRSGFEEHHGDNCAKAGLARMQILCPN